MIGDRQALRAAVRALHRSPAFAVTAVITLALGIAATLTVFSLAGALLLEAPPGIAAPGGLVAIEGQPLDLSYPDVVALHALAGALDGVAARKPWAVDFRVGDQSRPALAAMVSANYFGVLGIAPAAGRFLLPDEEAGPPGAHPVVVIGDALWRARFGANPHAVGATVRINGQPFTVVGVAPRDFHGVSQWDDEQVWVPLDMYAQVAPGLIAGLDRRPRWLSAVARLRAGATMPQARAEVAGIAGRLAGAYVENRDEGFGALGLLERQRADTAPYLALLGVVAAMTLLIACANVAGLQVARTAARRREIAIRAALGASRAGVARALLLEGLLISIAAAGAGLFLAALATRALAVWLHSHAGIPGWLVITADWRVVVAAVLLAGVTTLLFAALPAVHAARADLVEGLKDSAHGVRGLRLRRTLLVAQAALSLLIVTGGGALGHRLRALLEAPLATAPSDVLQVALAPAREGYDATRALTLYDALAERARALPGVVAVSFARNRVPRDESFFDETVTTTGAGGPDTVRGVSYDVVGSDYFRTVGPPLVAGRDVGARDREGAPLVVVVNRTLAQRLWRRANPVGRRLVVGGAEREVIGVAPDRAGPGGARPFFYLPLAQRNPWPASGARLLLRVTGRPERVLGAVREAVAALDANIPAPSAQTLADAVRDDAAPQLLAAGLVGGAGAFALLLSALGLYGLVAYLVSLRARELAVRAALGASAGRLGAQVLREGVAITAWGVALGVPLALAVIPVGLRVVFGSGVDRDPASLVAGSALLLVAAGAACAGPARRAARADPMAVLRSE